MRHGLKLYLVVALLAAAFSIVRLSGAQDANDASELLHLEDVWNNAYLKSDANSVGDLLADDVVITLTDMKVMDKPTALGILSTGMVKFDKYSTSDLRIRIYHDAAVVTGQLDRVRKISGVDTQDRSRFTKVYVRQNGKWLVVAWQASTANAS